MMLVVKKLSAVKIGVISDTHIPERCEKVPAEVIDAFEGVELILHAGDLTSTAAIEELKKIAPVKAVCGNMDSLEFCKNLPLKEIIRIGKFSIGLIHGRGNPKYLVDFVKNQFAEKPDVIIFGHSHKPMNEKINGTLFFNPGSPTDTMFAPYRSCGILEINDKIKAQIIRLND